MLALAAAVVLGLVIDPALAIDAGFALSVLATGVLVLLAPGWSTGEGHAATLPWRRDTPRGSAVRPRPELDPYPQLSGKRDDAVVDH